MTDDQRVDDMDVMPKTRRLIGRRGVTFQRALATFPLCCPSRATYLTGQYAHNHGVRDNHAPNGGVTVFDDTVTVPLALQEDGYTTAFFGKYMNDYHLLLALDPPYVPPLHAWRARCVRLPHCAN